MYTIFDAYKRKEIIQRIENLNENSSAGWGKMNIYQMIKHCVYWESWIQGKGDFRYKQELLGRIFGRMALKKMIGNDKPFDKNVPTSNQFKIAEIRGDFEADKLLWLQSVEAYADYHNPVFIHDFFGKMSVEEIGILVYKHNDHHLRQFGG